MFETLRRICQSLNSGLDLGEVLQAIVEALCDHTSWQLSFIYAMDTEGGFGEIAARRDRIEYTPKSPKPRWAFSGNPALDAHRRNEVIAVPDVAQATGFPELQGTAAKGITAAAYLPLSSADLAGRPMVLCVQSTLPVLNDPSQMAFLRAVASLASLAATNARLLSEARTAGARASDSAALLASVIEGVTSARPSAELLAEVEARTARSLVVLTPNGQAAYVGHPPAGESHDAPRWTEQVTAAAPRLRALAEQALREADGPSVPLRIEFDGMAPLSAVASPLGSDASAPLVLVISAGTAREPTLPASLAAAVVMLRDRLRLEAQATLRRDIIVQLLEGDFADDYDFARRAAFAGVPLDASQVIVVVSAAARLQAERVGNVLRAHARRWASFHLEYVDGHFVLLIPVAASQQRQLASFLDSIADLAIDASGEPGLTVTVSGFCARPSDYAPAWRDCVQALQLADRVHRTGVVRIDEFGAYRLLLPALAGHDLDQFVRAAIGPVLDSDGQTGGALFATLESFTLHGGRFQDTARQLNIHVSTLRYRLQRIESLLGRELADNETRFDLTLAARLERLRRGMSDCGDGH